MFWIQVITMGVIKGAEDPNHDPLCRGVYAFG
jgi:hypothetical protein